LDVTIPSAFFGQRGFTPTIWIWRPSFERQKDFNPPEQRATQRALPACRRSRSCTTSLNNALSCKRFRAADAIRHRMSTAFPEQRIRDISKAPSAPSPIFDHALPREQRAQRAALVLFEE